jgi:hypothetical protein
MDGAACSRETVRARGIRSSSRRWRRSGPIWPPATAARSVATKTAFRSSMIRMAGATTIGVLLYVFDLLELDAEDFRPQPLHARKARLEKLLAAAPASIQFNEHVEGDGQLVFRPRLPQGPGGDCLEAPRSPVPLRPVQGLAQDQEPGGPGASRGLSGTCDNRLARSSARLPPSRAR